MRMALVVLALVACGHSKRAPSWSTRDPEPVVAAVPSLPVRPPPPPPMLDDAGATNQSLALMAALDSRDAAAFENLTTESFALYERARTYERTRSSAA